MATTTLDENNTKTMTITGQNNRYKMKEVMNCGMKPDKIVRAKMKNVDEELLLGGDKQIAMINKMYIGCDDANIANTDGNNVLLKQELEKKIGSYKQQDMKKEIYDAALLITLAELIEKLVISKLKCAYCSGEVLLLYKNAREEKQWTLDRKYNDDCHSNENTVISCLKCNLERRVKNVDKFTFSKKMRIKKEL
jgi:hypothetical protein